MAKRASVTHWQEKVRTDAPNDDLAEKVIASIQSLFDIDAFLFQIDANERAISHRLAVHLSSHFYGWHIDCEYNRDGYDAKRLRPDSEILNVGDTDGGDTDGSRVFPDVIVHCRGTPRNHLVIEVKKSTSRVSDCSDLDKLNRFRDQLLYEHALFVKFQCGEPRPDVVTAQWVLAKRGTDIVSSPCPGYGL